MKYHNHRIYINNVLKVNIKDKTADIAKKIAMNEILDILKGS